MKRRLVSLVSYLWRRWRLGVQQAHRCSLDSQKPSWTEPGGWGLSTQRPSSRWTNGSQTLSLCFKSANLQGQKTKQNTWERERDTLSPIKSLVLFMDLCDMSNQRLPGAPWAFGRLSAEVPIFHPDFWEHRKNWWALTKWSQAPSSSVCTHFHLGKIMFVFQRVTNRWRNRTDSLEKSSYFLLFFFSTHSCFMTPHACVSAAL